MSLAVHYYQSVLHTALSTCIHRSSILSPSLSLALSLSPHSMRESEHTSPRSAVHYLFFSTPLSLTSPFIVSLSHSLSLCLFLPLSPPLSPPIHPPTLWCAIIQRHRAILRLNGVIICSSLIDRCGVGVCGCAHASTAHYAPIQWRHIAMHGFVLEYCVSIVWIHKCVCVCVCVFMCVYVCVWYGITCMWVCEFSACWVVGVPLCVCVSACACICVKKTLNFCVI